MAERKLASIQKIISIEPIEGADRIVKAKILGWGCVVKKDEFKPDDLCVFIEPDSILPPDNPHWEFMKERGYRVRSCKFKKTFSQGLAFPISILPTDYHQKTAIEGDDVTELLNIKKYESEISTQLSGTVKGTFPGFIRKTDEYRIQSYPKVIDEFAGKKVYITTKIDGSSGSYYYKNGLFGVCSRNREYKEPTEDDKLTSAYWEMAYKYNIKEGLTSLGRNLAIQGECFGQGIQGNKLALKQKDFAVFNVFDIDNYKYLGYNESREIINKLNMTSVSVEKENVEYIWNSIDELLELAKGYYANTMNFKEGIVIRPMEECYSNTLEGRLSIKVINNDFLLKYE